MPPGCRIAPYHYLDNYFANQFISNTEQTGISCDVKDENFYFDFKLQNLKMHEYCKYRYDYWNKLELKFSYHQHIILKKDFNIQGVVDFLLSFSSSFTIHLSNVEGFSIDLGLRHRFENVPFEHDINIVIPIVNTKMDFFANGKLVKSCKDIIEAYNKSKVSFNSIFQLTPNKKSDYQLLNCQYK